MSVITLKENAFLQPHLPQSHCCVRLNLMFVWSVFDRASLIICGNNILCIVLFYVLFVLYPSVYCLCVNVYYCHRVTTKLQLTNISYHKMPTRCNRWFLLQILLLAQHVSGTIMPIIRSSRVLYRRLLPVVFGASSPQTGHITLSSTPYRQLENQSTKYDRQ